MSKDLRFDGKVVIVTGAGNGLGRSHALAFGARGAKVVVNDLGGSHTGDGKSATAADKVVDEIKAAGGQAVANYDSVEDGDKIIKTAVDAFGRVDVLINNAGILRDVSFQKMTEADWDLVYRVHVRGAFKTSFAAWPVMREQKYGRIIFTASAAGIYGNFGQANYSMAKLGLVGLSNTLAIEGKKNNVVVNTIAPIAGSRMTETVLPPNLLEALKVEYVTALVVKLCHESHEDGGGLYEVGGGFYSRLRWERTKGKMYRLGRDVTPEDVNDAWGEITSWDDATHPANINASLEPIMDNVNAGKSKGGNQYVDVDAALGYQFPEMTSKYDERDLSIYALGIGAAEDPAGADLKLVYEMHGDGMVAAPSYGVIPALNCILTMGKEGKTAPGLKYGLDRVLHGEQYLELVRPLPLKAKLTHKIKIKDIWDKGSDGGKKGGAVVVTAIDTFDENGELLVKNETSTFVRGAGGWGGDRGPDEKNLNAAPDRAPDAVVEQKIPANQALLYRLAGDWNPLHADPGFAKAFGFDRPILHGLCTFGYAARHVTNKFAPGAEKGHGDPRFFKSIKVRFVDPVLPGETIVTEMWKESDTKILFRVKSKERDKVVISNAAVELFKEIPKAKEKPKAAAPAAAAGAGPVVPNSADVFGGISAFLAKSGADAVGQAKTVFAFKLSNPSSVWTLDLKNGNGSVASGEPIPSECTFEISDADFMDMVSGKADAMKLFTTGKLKIGGNVMASQKLGPVLKKVDPNDVMAAAQKRTGGSASAAPAASSAAPAGDAMPNSADVFAGISAFLAKKGADAVGQTKTIFAFKLKSPESVWTLDLKNGNGSVAQGEPVPAECTFEISDSDFMDMVSGKADAMKLFTTGKLKISGNVMASQKLGPVLKNVDPSDVLAATQKRTGGSAAPVAVAAAPAAAPAGDPTSADIFGGISRYVAKNGELSSKIKTVFQFKLRNPEAVWTIDLKNGAGSVGKGETSPSECTLELSDADFMDMCTGKADAMKLFTTGKLKITGNVMASQKLDFLRKVDPADVLAAMKERAGGGATPAAAASTASSAAAKASGIVAKIEKRIAENASLAKEVGAVVELRVKDPDAVWTLDLKNGAGSVKSGKADKPDAILTISDDNLAQLAASNGQLQSFYQHGKLRLDGDAHFAPRLAFLGKLGS
jgi:3-hydroxyacyl-CoA dehydrogenase/3a,7a,12a-trihydroxy-5b-cholest-24-enoyl-CoA hydratase